MMRRCRWIGVLSLGGLVELGVSCKVGWRGRVGRCFDFGREGGGGAARNFVNF